MLQVRVRVRGAAEVERALGGVPDEGRKALVRRANELAYNLQRRMKRAAARQGGSAPKAARTTRVARGNLLPTVTAGPSPVLFGSEFGALRRFGWYAHPRYFHSAGRQYPPHRGSSSYWFFRTQTEAKPAIDAAWRQAADDVIRAWSA